MHAPKVDTQIYQIFLLIKLDKTQVSNLGERDNTVSSSLFCAQ